MPGNCPCVTLLMHEWLHACRRCFTCAQERPFKSEMALLLDIFHQIYRGVDPEALAQVCSTTHKSRTQLSSGWIAFRGAAVALLRRRVLPEYFSIQSRRRLGTAAFETVAFSCDKGDRLVAFPATRGIAWLLFLRQGGSPGCFPATRGIAWLFSCDKGDRLVAVPKPPLGWP